MPITSPGPIEKVMLRKSCIPVTGAKTVKP